MSRSLQCENVQTLGNAHSHNTPGSRTNERTLEQVIGLKALASAVIGRSLPRTFSAQCEQSPYTLPAQSKAFPSSLDVDLERRILAMAERWDYSGDELALVLEYASQDSAGWLKVIEADERGHDGKQD